MNSEKRVELDRKFRLAVKDSREHAALFLISAFKTVKTFFQLIVYAFFVIILGFLKVGLMINDYRDQRNADKKESNLNKHLYSASKETHYGSTINMEKFK